MLSKQKLYHIYCYISIFIGILLILLSIIEFSIYKIINEGDIIINIYGIFLLIGGIGCLIAGIFSLGIISISSCTPSFVCMILLSNNEEFWHLTRFDTLIILILGIIFGLLLIIFYEETEEIIEPDVKDLTLKELSKIKKKDIEKLNMIGIVTLKDLIDEEDNLKEISKITDIERLQLRKWLKEAKEYEKEYYEYKKELLRKSYRKLSRKKR